MTLLKRKTRIHKITLNLSTITEHNEFPYGLFRQACQVVTMNRQVQRSLAPRRVMLSRRIIADYDLIRHSRPLRSIYG